MDKDDMRGEGTHVHIPQRKQSSNQVEDLGLSLLVREY